MRSVAYLSLGCDKNRVDTERLLYALHSAGFSITRPPEPAHLLVINTCAFIDPAKEESIAAIMEAVQAKQRGEYQILAVVGCLVERYKSELARQIPEVDFWMGLEHVTELTPCLFRHFFPPSLEKKNAAAPAPETAPPARPFPPRLLSTPRHYSFLKIAEGCNSACRFCAIPLIRGKRRSVPIEDLVEEARALESAGVKELNLVAQDLTAYGRDLSPRRELADLLENLLLHTRLPWFRLLYAHPARLTGRLIDLLAREDRLLHYLDLPLQHISDRLLAAMGRPPAETIRRLLDRLAERVPRLVLRTTFLVGFPGETDRDFAELLDFVAEGRFLWAAAFAYSPQEGTPAAALKNRPPRRLVEERLNEFFDLQREITRRRLAEYIGRRITVLVDEEWARDSQPSLSFSPRKRKKTPPSAWQGRFSGQAVDVDGVVKLIGVARPGEFVKAEVTESWDYDLQAKKIPPPKAGRADLAAGAGWIKSGKRR